ncbi:MAG: hypothetical protein AAGC63_02960, partial [Propionicimonas sp.]|nr:hypothetical protein [Propionicimonas sp.]
MDEIERAFRDALRRADFVAVPVAPIDPDEIAGRAGARRPRRLGGLAAAAAVVLVVGVGAGVWLSNPRGSTPAVPATPPAAVVEVDLFSGRANPTVVLSGTVADDLYGMLADQAALGAPEAADPPGTGLGFRGFVVQPADQTRPVLRILPGSVYVDSAGGPELVRDPSGGFFSLVADALPADVMEQVRQASVQIRVGNAGPSGLDAVEVTFPDNQVVDYGAVAAGEASDYHLVGLAYRYSLIVATADGEERRWQPIDFVGETPLAPGRYTYELSVDGADGIGGAGSSTNRRFGFARPENR